MHYYDLTPSLKEACIKIGPPEDFLTAATEFSGTSKNNKEPSNRTRAARLLEAVLIIAEGYGEGIEVKDTGLSERGIFSELIAFDDKQRDVTIPLSEIQIIVPSSNKHLKS